MINLQKIVTYEELLKLKNEWDELLENSSENTPFLSFDWIRLCVEYYGEGKMLNIIVIRDEKELIGIIPLWKFKDVIRKLPVVKLEMINNPDSPFVDFIVSDQRGEEVINAFLTFLLVNDKEEWDILNIQRIPEDSDNSAALKAALGQNKIKYFTSYPTLMPYIPIEDSWENFLQSRSRKFRKTRRNINNRFKSLDNVEILCYTNDRDANLLDEIIQISKKSWKHSEGIAISSDEKTIGFFESLNHIASSRNCLRVWLVKVGGKPIAMEYDIECGGNIFALRADFDEDFKEYSPGSFLEYHIIKNAFDKKLGEYNSGPGVRDYKTHWTDHVKECVNLYICNQNIKGKNIWLLENHIVPFLRKLRDRFNKKREIQY